MAIKAAVVAEDKLVEVGVDVLAAKTMVGAEAPTLQESEDTMYPLQWNVRRHVADDAGIMPVGGLHFGRRISDRQTRSATGGPATAGRSFPHRETTLENQEGTTVSSWRPTYRDAIPRLKAFNGSSA